MAIPESSPCQWRSTAAAMAAAALPAAATNVRPRGGGGRCAARIFSGSAAATAARKLSSRSARSSGKLTLRGGGAEIEELGIGLAEHALDVLRRHVGVLAAPAHVLHVAPVVLVVRMENRVGPAVELERLHAKALAQAQIERRRGLDPLALQVELGVAVIDEEVGAHLLGELRRRQVVLHVREADTRRNAGGARGGSEQRRLGHAPAEVLLEARRGAVGVLRQEVLERVVADAVAHRVVKRDRAFARIGALRMLGGERHDLRMAAVDEASWLQVFVHLSSFISLRTPWKSALCSSARPSTTEKWCRPGMGTSPAKPLFQRSPRSAFCRRNSLDSSPPTQVITGARVERGRNAGESLSAVAGSSRRSTFSQSMSTSGRRSYRPLMARPPFHRSFGSARSNAGHCAHISIAVRWPPAEWPLTYRRSWSMPYSSACSQSQRLARSIWRTISCMEAFGQRS